MTLTEIDMADSVNPASLVGLPPNITAFAGYANGSWADFVAIAQAHPGSYLLDFTVRLQADPAGDFEPGDMNPSDAVPYYHDSTAAGIWRPCLYASIGGYMGQIVANLNGAGIPLKSTRLLSAHYGAGKHICGPTTCKIGPAALIQMDGTQWIDHGTWDESVLLGDFFDNQPPIPPTPAPPNPTIKIPQEIIMGLPTNCTDHEAVNSQIREWWNLYRTDPMTLADIEALLWSFYVPTSQNGFSGSANLLQAHIVDDAKSKNALKPDFANAV